MWECQDLVGSGWLSEQMLVSKCAGSKSTDSRGVDVGAIQAISVALCFFLSRGLCDLNADYHLGYRFLSRM